ncbi:unnamed protein product [Rotaria socialis]|uniref:Protein MAK10 homolog n=2 Tax=Rotaria socialis TaxID=392032 RepID=A0A821PW94_9BILA|nr:unnamed protein product [Rotaria socialis]CAF3512344.1 unnamed protein product [Rotaria socialis]CAF3734778.1 unnamed protein product [Rotaria socialis]CAF4812418.1 unnamed protein product [Rotaria socialis]
MQETIGDTTYDWTDATSHFADLCRHLPIGEVVRDADFTLFEAMTALELMDPKMDGGMSIKHHFQEQKQGNRILTLKQLIDKQLLKITKFTSTELIYLFDQLLSTFHMWLDGHSLALTLFTCVYLHDVTIIDDSHLRTICFTFIKLVDYIRERILLKAGLFEEEDFSGTLTYNFPFYRDFKEQTCLTDLKKSEDELNKRLRSLKHQTELDQVDINATQQLIYRIRFLRYFFGLTVKFNEANEKTGEQTYLNTEEISKYLKQIDEMLQLIRPSFIIENETTPTDDNSQLNISQTLLTDISRSFDPYYNYRQLPPAFNRFIRQLIFPSFVYKSLVNICQQLRKMLEINDKRTLKQSFEFFLEYSTHEKPSLFIRSLLLLSYLPSVQGCLLSSRKIFGQISFAEQVKCEIRSFIVPPLLTLKSISIDNETLSCSENFFQRACVPFSNLFYSLCNNHARTREKLSNLLEEFSVLQDESEKLDQWLHKYLIQQIVQANLSTANAQTLLLIEKTSYFFQFILNWTLLIMEYYLLMGFDLSLYSKRELYDVYFYFAQIILFTHINVYKTSKNILNTTVPFLVQLNQKQQTNKNQINNQFIQQMNSLIQHNSNDDPLAELTNENNATQKKTKRKNPNVLVATNNEYHEQELLLIHGHFAMSTAMHRCLKALDIERRLKFSSNDSNYFLRDEIRYRHRFLPFANLCAPPYMPHTDFLHIQHLSDNRYTASELYQDAINNFSQAKTYFETYLNRITTSKQYQQQTFNRTFTTGFTSLIDAESYIRIAKTNGIVLKLLLGGHKPDVKIDFDFSLHAHYPTLKL